MPKNDEALRIFVAMPGTDMGPTARWNNPEEIKRFFLVPIKDKLQEALNLPIELVIEKDKDLGGPIPSSMFAEAYDADVYIADLTGNNPNVYLELGVRWATKDGVTLLLSQDMGDIRFNAAYTRAIPYNDNPEALTAAITKAVNMILAGLRERDHCDSPVREKAGVLSYPKAYIDKLEGENQRLKAERGEDLLIAAKAAEDPVQRLALLHQAVAINPALVKGFLALGVELRLHGQYDESIRIFKKAVGTDPSCGVCFRELGVSYNKNEQVEKAVDALREAVRLAPNDAEAFSNLGGALRRWGMREAANDQYDWDSLRDARNAYEKAATLDSPNRYALMNVARLDLLLSKVEPQRKAMSIGRFKQLRHLCAFEVDEDPTGYWSRFDLADTHLFSEDVKEGYRLYLEALQYVPDPHKASVLSSVTYPSKEFLQAGVVDGETKDVLEKIISQLPIL